MKQLWQAWYGGLNHNQIEKLTQIGEMGTPANANLGFSGDSANQNYRSSEIKWINPNDYESEGNFCKDLINYYANEANRNAFGFDIQYLNDIQFTKYHSTTNDKYDWHIDTFWCNPTMYHRKLTVVIQLSNENDYVGGNFEFDPQYENPNQNDLRKIGTVLVFPSFLPHRVTTITSGIRKSIVAWVEGPCFK